MRLSDLPWEDRRQPQPSWTHNTTKGDERLSDLPFLSGSQRAQCVPRPAFGTAAASGPAYRSPQHASQQGWLTIMPHRDWTHLLHAVRLEGEGDLDMPRVHRRKRIANRGASSSCQLAKRALGLGERARSFPAQSREELDPTRGPFTNRRVVAASRHQPRHATGAAITARGFPSPFTPGPALLHGEYRAS
jgi:hypothetical protein